MTTAEKTHNPANPEILFENGQRTVTTWYDGQIRIIFEDAPFGPYHLITKLNLEEAREYYNF